MPWNFNMDEAPRGTVEIVTREVKGKVQQMEKFTPQRILATNGVIVTMSNWIPPKKGPPAAPGRWNMFSADRPPIAWMEWPEAPTADEIKAQQNINGKE